MTDADLYDRGIAPLARREALAAIEASYTAGVDRFAVWVHESDDALQADLEQHGYAFIEATRAMGMLLEDIVILRPEIDLAPADLGGAPAHPMAPSASAISGGFSSTHPEPLDGLGRALWWSRDPRSAVVYPERAY
jgi:hypothetical protein